MDEEIWKKIDEFENYEISTYGRIRSLPRLKKNHNSINSYISKGRILKINTNSRYSLVSLKIKGKQFSRTIHRLVAKAFIPNPENKPEVNHKDFNRHNNYLFNLEWATRDENLSHAIAGNRVAIGENHYKSKRIKNIITGEIIGSASEVSKLYKIPTSSLNRFLLSKQMQKISFLRYID